MCNFNQLYKNVLDKPNHASNKIKAKVKDRINLYLLYKRPHNNNNNNIQNLKRDHKV